MRWEQIELTVHDLWDSVVGEVHSEVGIARRLVHLVHTGNTLDLPSASLGVVSLPVDLLAPFQRSRHVNQEEVSATSRDTALDSSSVLLQGCNRRGNNGRTGFRQFRSDETDSSEVECLVLGAEGDVLVSGGRVSVVRVKLVAEEEGDGSTAVLL